MKNLWLFVVLMMLCCGASAQTSEVIYTSGNAFLRICPVVDKETKTTTTLEDQDTVACVLYVAGIVRGAELGSAVTRAETKQTTLPKLFCRPDDVENDQLVRVGLKYVRENPEKAHEETAWIVMWAMRKAFPCLSK